MHLRPADALRKLHELRVLGSCHTQLEPNFDIAREKLIAAAALKARFAAENPHATETSWSGSPVRHGACEHVFQYQRADLETSGLEPYVNALPAGLEIAATLPVASGMAALSVAMMIVRRLGVDRISTTEGHYAETAELAKALGLSLDWSARPGGTILLDSAVPSSLPWAPLMSDARLILFDTTCFPATSGRIRRALARFPRNGAVGLLLRSHTKLDCLGVEYGRLGSLCVVCWPADRDSPIVQRIVQQVRDLVRLLGVAATPAHFPPFVAHPDYNWLSRLRAARIMRNTRLIERLLAGTRYRIAGYQHKMFVAVELPHCSDRAAIGAHAEAIARKLRGSGLPVRAAGSFGFDFFGVSWFSDSRYSGALLRVSSGDVPANVAERVGMALRDEILRITLPEAAARLRHSERNRRPR